MSVSLAVLLPVASVVLVVGSSSSAASSQQQPSVGSSSATNSDQTNMDSTIYFTRLPSPNGIKNDFEITAIEPKDVTRTSLAVWGMQSVFVQECRFAPGDRVRQKRAMTWVTPAGFKIATGEVLTVVESLESRHHCRGIRLKNALNFVSESLKESDYELVEKKISIARLHSRSIEDCSPGVCDFFVTQILGTDEFKIDLAAEHSTRSSAVWGLLTGSPHKLFVEMLVPGGSWETCSEGGCAFTISKHSPEPSRALSPAGSPVSAPSFALRGCNTARH